MPQATSRSETRATLDKGAYRLSVSLEEELGVEMSAELTSILSSPEHVRAMFYVRRDGGDFSINLLSLSPGERNALRAWVQKTRAVLDRVEALLDDQARKTGAAQ